MVRDEQAPVVADRSGDGLLAPRWDGTPGRLEVTYATFTDAATGTGAWLHHELVASEDGTVDRHGWIALFPADGPPVCERFRDVGLPTTPGVLTGEVAGASWDLRYEQQGPPLFTFPRWVWERALLPGQQVVPAPTARFSGRVRVGDVEASFAGPGGLARIYGHGNAERWVWLHADLGGGDVLEVVAAVSRRTLLRRLPMRALVQLRLDGQDWPPDSLLALPRTRASVDGDRFTVSVRWGRQRLVAEAEVPTGASVSLEYTDPDGAKAVCTNSERANARIALQRREGRLASRWRTRRRWDLERTAHAEIGRR